MTDWVKGVVAASTHWTEHLFSLRIDADIDAFEAGQYTWLALDSAFDGQPYSILSAPSEQTLEFFFYSRITGEHSQQLSKLNPGQALWVKRQAAGKLTLSQIVDSQVLCLLATGTGVAPFISMLKTAEPWQRFEQVVLAYAVRQSQDLQYRHLFDALSAQHGKRFRLIPFISREPAAALGLPDAIQGHIPSSLSSGEFESVLGTVLTPQNSQVMLCGNPGMVRDVCTLLQTRGFTDNLEGHSGQLTYEAYW